MEGSESYFPRGIVGEFNGEFHRVPIFAWKGFSTHFEDGAAIFDLSMIILYHFL